MTSEQQPTAPRPGPHLFGGRPDPGAPAAEPTTPETDAAAPADVVAARGEPDATGAEDHGGTAAENAGEATAATSAAPTDGTAGTTAEGAAGEGAGGTAGSASTDGTAGTTADGLEPTGEPQVDEALTVLAGLAGRPTADQVDGYEQVHRALQDVLATVDDA